MKLASKTIAAYGADSKNNWLSELPGTGDVSCLWVFERVPSRPWLSFSLRCGAVWGSVGNENGSASGKRLKDAHCLKTNWQENVVLHFVSSDSLGSLDSTMRVSSNVSAWGSEQILHSGTHSSCCTSSVATTCWHRRRHIPISWVWVLSCLVSAREQNSCRV